jgi:hypothetical protein
MASRLKMYLRNTLRELVSLPVDRLLEARYQRFRRMGVFLEGPAGDDVADDGNVPAPADAPLPTRTAP